MTNNSTNSIEVTPGPEQQKLEATTAVAVTALIERNEKLTLALRRIVIHLSLLQVMSAKQIAEDALEEFYAERTTGAPAEAEGVQGVVQAQ